MSFQAQNGLTRRHLDLLHGRQRTVGEAAGNFRMSRPAISKHLRLLRSAGLVATRQEGTTNEPEREPETRREPETKNHPGSASRNYPENGA
jgi:DNA-binding transcriptional ArsR family regulator